MSASEEFPYKPRSRKQEMMLDSKANLTIIGGAAGSSKSFTQILHPLSFIHDPKFTGVFFRRTTVQVSGAGGLWDTAQEVYMKLPVQFRPRFRESSKEIIFPSGAKLKMTHMEHVKNKFDHQGLQYSAIDKYVALGSNV